MTDLFSISRLLPYLVALASGSIWGITFSLARIATEGGAHPLGLSLWQAFGGGLVLLSFCLVSGQWPSLDRKNLCRMLILGLIGTALPGSLLFYAAAHVPAGVLAITVALVPILTYACAALLGMDKLSVLRGGGVVAGFLAILMIMLPDSSLPQRDAVGWLLLAMLSVFFYTAENLYVDRYVPAGTGMTGLLMGSMFMAALVLAPVVVLQNARVSVTLPLDAVGIAVVGMAVISAVAYLMYLYLIKISGPVFASMSGYVVTLSGLLWAILIFNEQHSAWVWSALLLMFLGIGLVTPRHRQPT